MTAHAHMWGADRLLLHPVSGKPFAFMAECACGAGSLRPVDGDDATLLLGEILLLLRFAGCDPRPVGEVEP